MPSPIPAASVGQPMNRVDGPLKVCGQAPYAAEVTLPRMAHAVLVTSHVARGRVRSVDVPAALQVPGVLAVLWHGNAPRLPNGGKPSLEPPAGRVLSLLQDDAVRYNGEPVAVVVADALEAAQEAARRLRVDIVPAPSARLDFDHLAQTAAYPPKEGQKQPADSQRGDVAQAMSQAAHRIEERYSTPVEHHNPMEPHATLAAWDGPRLTLYDATQYVTGARNAAAKTLGIDPELVRVIDPYVGGGFGCKGSTWSHVMLAAMAARHVGRPVRLVLERPQLFGSVGNRPATRQKIALGCDAGGRLVGTRHEAITETSALEDWVERSTVATRMLYACDNLATSQRLVKLDIATPTFMRAPGETSGTFALECAMDELAFAAGVDPLEFRLRNHAETDQDKKKPYSSKSLRACYQAGAERFGWSRRQPQPGSMRQGHWQVGMGVGTATYPTNRSAAQARAVLLPDGSALVQSGSQDLGTGTFTVMTQVAADALGLPPARVRFELGDSALPKAPVSGGSQSAASVSPAVRAACLAVRRKLVEMAVADDESPLHGISPDLVASADGWLRGPGEKAEPFGAVLARRGGQPLEASAESAPGTEKNDYSMHAFGAVFVEVHVDPLLGVIRVPRIVGAYGIGRLLNEKTGRSQLMGGIVWGVSAALFEETRRHPVNGRYVNTNLAAYHVPVNADIGEVDVIVVPEDDPKVNPLGVKGIGEIGITGVAGAISNAVFHATGRRVRDLPITLDKLL